MDIGNRLRLLAKQAKMTQNEIAHKAHLSQPYVSELFRGKKQPNLNTLEILCDIMGISLADFFSERLPDIPVHVMRLAEVCKRLSPEQTAALEHIARMLPTTDTNGTETIPDAPPIQKTYGKAQNRAHKIGYVAAGEPIEAIEQELDDDREDDIPSGAAFGLVVRGRSMEPCIPNGSTIWIDNTAPVDDGDIGVFMIDGEATCKRLRITCTGVVLESINPDFEPLFIPDYADLRVVGKVIW